MRSPGFIFFIPRGGPRIPSDNSEETVCCIPPVLMTHGGTEGRDPAVGHLSSGLDSLELCLGHFPEPPFLDHKTISLIDMDPNAETLEFKSTKDVWFDRCDRVPGSHSEPSSITSFPKRGSDSSHSANYSSSG